MTTNAEIREARAAFKLGAEFGLSLRSSIDVTETEAALIDAEVEGRFRLKTELRYRVLRWYNNNYRVRAGRLEIERYSERSGGADEKVWTVLSRIEGDLLDRKFFEHLVDLMTNPNEQVEVE